MSAQPARRRHRVAIVALLIVAAAVAALALRWSEGRRVTAQAIARRDFVQSVVASGRVESKHRVDVGSQITGAVKRIPVDEGQAVKAGDLLVELESSELGAAQRQADAALAQARARVRQLRSVSGPVAEQALRQARTSLETAQAQLRRNEELAGKGFIGAAALDDSRKAVELADAQLRTAQKQLETMRPGGSDYELANAAVDQARAAAELARARAAYARITAPVDGTLIARNVEVGDVVQPGKTLMTLAPAGRTQLVLAVDERNLRLLAVGQHAIASADAYPAQRFDAVLAYINPGVNAQTGAVEVKLDVPSPPAFLREDMTVSVDVEVARHREVLVAPVDALRDPDGPSPWVLRIERHRAIRVPVTLGLRSEGFVEVVAGLEAGDRVVVSPRTLADGARVHEAAADH